MTPIEFRGDLWQQKTRLPGVSCGVVCVILRFAVLVELRLVTDTDMPACLSIRPTPGDVVSNRLNLLLFIITTYYCDCERVFCNSLYFMFLHFILYCGQL